MNVGGVEKGHAKQTTCSWEEADKLDIGPKREKFKEKKLSQIQIIHNSQIQPRIIPLFSSRFPISQPQFIVHYKGGEKCTPERFLEYDGGKDDSRGESEYSLSGSFSSIRNKNP